MRKKSTKKLKKISAPLPPNLSVKDIRYVPISALKGDNVVEYSENMPWYGGGTLRYILENIHVGSDWNHIDPRFPVQYVIRPISDKYHDYRGYAGRVAGGVFRRGDKVMILPSGFVTTIESIDFYDQQPEEALSTHVGYHSTCR